MKFNLTEEVNKNSFRGIFFIDLMTKYCEKYKNKKQDVTFEKTFINTSPHPGIVTLEMKINGIEVDPVEFVDEIESQMERMVAEKAEAIIATKMSDIEAAVDEILKR